MNNSIKTLLALLAALALIFAAGCDSSGDSDSGDGTDTGSGNVSSGTGSGSVSSGTPIRYGDEATEETDYTIQTDGSWLIYTEIGLWAWAESDDVLTTGCTLNNDIELTIGLNSNYYSSTWIPVGSKNNPYTGTFDGGGNTITGLAISRSSDYTGFFGALGEGGTVKNLDLADVAITATSTTAKSFGAVAGVNYGTIEGCTVSGNIAGGNSAFGGVAGSNSGGIIRGCSSSAAVAANGGSVGGIAGSNTGTVIACYSIGDVTGNDNKSYIGGVVGWNFGSSAEITGCYYNGGTLTNNNARTGAAGGIAGYNSATITACYWSIGSYSWSSEDEAAGDASGSDTDGSVNVDGSEVNWSTGNNENNAMSAMNSAISNDSNGGGWQYTANTDSSSNATLVLGNTTSG